MNAHPKTAALTTQLEVAEPAEQLNLLSMNILFRLKTLFPVFETGKSINAKRPRALFAYGCLSSQSVSSTMHRFCGRSECRLCGLRPQHLDGRAKVRCGPAAIAALAKSSRTMTVALGLFAVI